MHSPDRAGLFLSPRRPRSRDSFRYEDSFFFRLKYPIESKHTVCTPHSELVWPYTVFSLVAYDWDIPALKNSITLFIIWSRFLLVLLDAFCFQMGGFVHGGARSQQTFRQTSTAAAALVGAWVPYFPRISSFLMNKGIFSVHIKTAAAAICLEMVKVQFHIKLMCTVFCPKSFRRVRALSASVISEALVVFFVFLISPGLIFPSVTI